MGLGAKVFFETLAFLGNTHGSHPRKTGKSRTTQRKGLGKTARVNTLGSEKREKMGIVEWMGWKEKAWQMEMFGKISALERLLVEWRRRKERIDLRGKAG